jgi:hypothetical protein
MGDPSTFALPESIDQGRFVVATYLSRTAPGVDVRGETLTDARATNRPSPLEETRR